MKQTLEQIADHNVDMVLLYTSSENIQSLLQEVSKRFFERISDKISFFTNVTMHFASVPFVLVFLYCSQSMLQMGWLGSGLQ